MPTDWPECDWREKGSPGANPKASKRFTRQRPAPAVTRDAYMSVNAVSPTGKGRTDDTSAMRKWMAISSKSLETARADLLEIIRTPTLAAGAGGLDHWMRANELVETLSQQGLLGVNADRLQSLVTLISETVGTLGLELAVTEAEVLANNGDIDGALAIIFDRLDEAFSSGAFGQVNKWLGAIDTDRFSSDVLLGVLAASFPAKSELPARQIFWCCVKETFARRDVSEDHLLAGLE